MMPPAFYRIGLCLISLRVPRPQRREWLAEWSAELWYVCESVAHTLPPQQQHAEITGFCRGAVEDARFLRSASHTAAGHLVGPIRASGSAIACTVSLAIVAMLGFLLAQNLPGVRPILHTAAYRAPTDVVSIAPSALPESISLGTARALRDRPQHVFSEFAFYEPVTRPVHLAPHRWLNLHIARSSANLFTLLSVHPAFPQPIADTEPQLMLSEATWRRQFGGSPEIFGQSVKVGVQTARVAGVVPEAAISAVGKFDAWLLLPAPLAANLPDNTSVVFLGRIAPRLQPDATARRRWQLTVPGEKGSVDYDCITLAENPADPRSAFLFAVFLALLALPATTPLSLGEYSPRRVSLPWTANLPRWLFLAAKLCLSLVTIFFGSMDLAYGVPWSAASTPQYLLTASTFAATLFALRWALRDQRQRCPVCLGKLTCPARVGEPSRNFLSWNGTELICAGGHGFLHVPELPTSWFSAPRWLHLDPSWRSLFFGPA